MRNNKGRGETHRGRVEREEEFLSRGRKGLRGVSSTSEPLSHPFCPTLFLRHLRLLGRFCSLRARRRAVCSSSPSVCRPPSVEDHVYNRVAVDLRRLPTLRAPSAASPPRIKRENTSPLLRFHSNFLPSFLRSLNECRSTCRVLFLFLRGVQRPRIFEEEEERVDLGKARETRRQVCEGGGWKGDDSPNLSSPRIDFEAAIDEIAGLDPFQPRRAKGLPL